MSEIIVSRNKINYETCLNEMKSLFCQLIVHKEIIPEEPMYNSMKDELNENL